MEIEANQDDRGYALIANFIDGFALGWKMAIPEAFKDALDIKLTPRKLAGKTEMILTQGRIYTFKKGDTLYDTKHAYQEWGEALKILKLSVQVQHAIPSGYVAYESIETKDKELVIVHQKGKAKPKEITVDNGLSLSKKRIAYGLVRFKVYCPNNDKTALEEKKEIECTQDDFVSFLQTGIVRTKQGKTIDLLEDNR